MKIGSINGGGHEEYNSVALMEISKIFAMTDNFILEGAPYDTIYGCLCLLNIYMSVICFQSPSFNPLPLIQYKYTCTVHVVCFVNLCWS